MIVRFSKKYIFYLKKIMINALGLLFFLPMINFSTEKGIICFIVIINGLLCHTTRYFKTYGWKYIRNYDIICNVLMGSFIIYKSNFNPILIYIMVHACIIFILNYMYYGHHYLLHILGVQLPLSIATYIF